MSQVETSTTNLSLRRNNSQSESSSAAFEEDDHVDIPDKLVENLQGVELDEFRPGAIEQSERRIAKGRLSFLLRLPIVYYGTCLGICSQGLLFKRLWDFTQFPAVKIIGTGLWFLGVILLSLISIAYILKIIMWPQAVRREFEHPVRVNFFFAPFLAVMFTILGSPWPLQNATLHSALFWIIMVPVLLLEINIYGLWMLDTSRNLQYGNPVYQMSVVGNFIGASFGARVHRDTSLFFFAIGLAFQVLIFITLFQRASQTRKSGAVWEIPKFLHPVVFLFLAPPSAASVAWANLHGNEFGDVSVMLISIALFLFFILVRYVTVFYVSNFSMSFWAYTFPLTALASGMSSYALMHRTTISITLSVIASVVAVLVVLMVLGLTVQALRNGKLFTPDPVVLVLFDDSAEMAMKNATKKPASPKAGNTTPEEELQQIVSVDSDD